jgi:hypothetical protein
MTQLGQPVPRAVSVIRRKVAGQLRRRGIAVVDAESEITGRDFLVKIWEMILSVPLGIAIISEELRPTTLANVSPDGLASTSTGCFDKQTTTRP